MVKCCKDQLSQGYAQIGQRWPQCVWPTGPRKPLLLCTGQHPYSRDAQSNYTDAEAFIAELNAEFEIKSAAGETWPEALMSLGLRESTTLTWHHGTLTAIWEFTNSRARSNLARSEYES